MDPTTTLVTFMLQTSSDIHSVALIGSWDNFTKHYPMERDIRRARGQWRGCYAFEDIICDGDEGNGSRRSGGLKMGSTYYYYYEVDGATEHHDASLPFTTSCPFLPGQPVNLLSVPFEVEPPRDRSGSMSSIANGHVKTMNPADKFVTPRPPPQPPVSLQRIKTSPSIPSLNKKRSARSLLPQSEKPASAPWSRTFFGLRSAHPPAASENNDRGRSASVDSGTIMEGDANIGYPVLISRSGSRKIRSVPQTRDVSPQSALVAQDILSRAPSTKTSSSSREISPVRLTFLSDNSSHHHNSFVVPDQIAEEEVEEDDDDNWATQFARMSFNNTEPLTSLSPAPSSGIRSPPPLLRNSLDKPLPELPETPLMPSPIRVHVAPELLPRSHFSTSTISTDVTSPTDSNFGFSDTQTPSTSDFNDDYQEELNEENDQFTFTPMGSSSASRNFNGGFSGYSLPDGEYASEQTLRKQTPLSPGSREGRITFGAGIGGDHRESLNALERFMNEMGYLGDHISGK